MYNCNNCSGNNNQSTMLKHVYGNVLRLAIPLDIKTLSVVDGEIEQDEQPFSPSAEHPVLVALKRGSRSYEYTADMIGNVATIEDRGTLPIGHYSVEVLCVSQSGDPMRFFARSVIDVVEATKDAGLHAGVEFDETQLQLEGCVFLAIQGGTGTSVGIERIDVDETDEPGEYNTITITLTDGTSKILKVRNGTAADFVHDGMIDSVEISNGSLVITWNTDAGKQPVSIPLTSIFDPSDYYNKSQSDAKFATKTDVNGKYTKPTGGIPASDMAPGVIPDVSGLVTQSALNNQVSTKKVTLVDAVDGDGVNITFVIGQTRNTLVFYDYNAGVQLELPFDDAVIVTSSTIGEYTYTKSALDDLLSEKADTDDIPTKTSELTNDSGFISADDAQLIEYKEYDDPADEWTDEPSVPTIGYYVGPMATDVGFWDGGFWNMFPTSDAIDVTIDAKLNRRINWVSSVGNHNQANSPLNLDCNDTHVIMNGVANSGDSTLYIQCSGIAGAGQQSECIIYFDCTSAAKSINWKNTISWVNDAPAFESGKIYEVSLCKIGDKWLGVYTEYASSVAMSNNLN